MFQILLDRTEPYRTCLLFSYKHFRTILGWWYMTYFVIEQFLSKFSANFRAHFFRMITVKNIVEGQWCRDNNRRSSTVYFYIDIIVPFVFFYIDRIYISYRFHQYKKIRIKSTIMKPLGLFKSCLISALENQGISNQCDAV